MDDVARLPAADRTDLFAATASRRALTPAVGVKDFRVCWTLKRVFTVPEPPTRSVSDSHRLPAARRRSSSRTVGPAAYSVSDDPVLLNLTVIHRSQNGEIQSSEERLGGQGSPTG